LRALLLWIVLLLPLNEVLADVPLYDQASVPAFLQTLNNLSAILDKAEAHARNRKIDPEVLLNHRLAPDMFLLVCQFQIAADLAKGAAAPTTDTSLNATTRRRAPFAEESHRRALLGFAKAPLGSACA
jgi:hypothetical protein